MREHKFGSLHYCDGPSRRQLSLRLASTVPQSRDPLKRTKLYKTPYLLSMNYPAGEGNNVLKAIKLCACESRVATIRHRLQILGKMGPDPDQFLEIIFGRGAITEFQRELSGLKQNIRRVRLQLE